MSACKSAKNELTKIKTQAECCSGAEVYGLLLFSGLCEGSVFRTEYENVARHIAQMTASYCGIYVEVAFPGRNYGKKLCSVAIPHEDQRIKAKAAVVGDEQYWNGCICRDILESECCRYAFIRGAFLASGVLCDPEKECRMEFCSKKDKLCEEFAVLLNEMNYKCTQTDRRGSRVLFLKDGESIEQLLAMIGATKASMEIMGFRIQRDIRNIANRRKNCDTANIKKVIAASKAQVEAINKIERCGGLESLPPELLELARLRIENSHMSLSELGECLSQPISRSGLNHRMKRIMEIAEGLKEKEELSE